MFCPFTKRECQADCKFYESDEKNEYRHCAIFKTIVGLQPDNEKQREESKQQSELAESKPTLGKSIMHCPFTNDDCQGECQRESTEECVFSYHNGYRNCWLFKTLNDLQSFHSMTGGQPTER